MQNKEKLRHMATPNSSWFPRVFLVIRMSEISQRSPQELSSIRGGAAWVLLYNALGSLGVFGGQETG